MAKLTNEERVIKFLLSKLPQSETNVVAINQNDIPTIGLSEREVAQSLHMLEDDGLIIIRQKSPDNDFSMY